MPALLTATQVAEILAITRRAFLARRRGLEQRHNFPAAVAGLPDRWDPAAIDAWLAAQRQATMPDQPSAEATLIARARTIAA
jgi:hypothetical protein